MLILSRTLGQEIVIDERVVVRILRVACGRVKLGITAPRAVTVNRREVANSAPKEHDRAH